MSLPSTMQKTFGRRRLSALQKLLSFYWMLIDMCSPKSDISQGTVAPNCFKSHTNSSCPDFFQMQS